MKPIIGISGNEYLNTQDDTEAVLSYVNKGFVDAIEVAGGIPLLLPILSPDMAKNYVTLIDKLILTGGQNVLPQYYEQEKAIESDNYHAQRDAFELALIQETIAQQKPLFGICRGMQLFNVAMGGTLYQAIPDHWQTIAADSPSQDVYLVSHSPLATIYGEKTAVNSFHRQALDQLAPDLQVIGRAEDGIVEAVMMTNNVRFIGVQWHPELLYYRRNEEKKLFDFLVNEF